MLPELISRAKSLLARLDPEPAPLTLDLDVKGGGPAVPFDLLNVSYYARNGFYRLYEMLGGGVGSWSGETVSPETALNHSVVYACTKIICEPCSFLRLEMKQAEPGSRQVREAVEHPMFNCMLHSPNCENTSMDFREAMTAAALLQGNGYAKITRRSGTGVAISIDPLLPSQVQIDREKQGKKRLVYVVYTGLSDEKTYTVEAGKPQDILHLKNLTFDGLRGASVLTLGRQSIGTAIAAERNVGRFFGHGGRVPYVLEAERPFKTDEDFDKFRADWERVYAEPHRSPILTNSMKYKQVGLSMADAQMLETRVFTVAEICRWFSVSPHLANDLSHATFSNIEQLVLSFYHLTLRAWTSRWEEQLWRCVLTPQEQADGYFFLHDKTSLLQGDFLSRMQGYASALQNGVVNRDEVRYNEGLNPMPSDSGEAFYVQQNMQTIPGTGAALQPPKSQGSQSGQIPDSMNGK